MVVGNDHRKSCKAFTGENTERLIGKGMNELEGDKSAAQEQKDRNSDEAGGAGSYELFDDLRVLDSILEIVDDFHAGEEMLDHVKEEIESARQKAAQRARKIRMCGVASTPYLDYLDYLDYYHADIGQSNANVDFQALYNQKRDRAKKESLRKKEAFNMLLNSLDEEQKTIVGKELSSLSYDHDQLIVTLIESFDNKDECSVLDAYRSLFSREQVLASFTDEQMELLKSTRWYMGGR